MMSESTDFLRQELKAARARRAALAQEIRDAAGRIGETRARLGNPFYYGGNTDRAHQGIDRFTGYASHDPGLRRLRDFQLADRECQSLRAQLRRKGETIS